MNSTERKELFDKVNKAKVVSFDLFDTLLFRKTTEPEQIFDIVGSYFGIPAFRKLRINTQNDASRRVTEKYGYPHPDMDEIYEEFSLGEKTTESHIDWDAVKAYEIQVESEALFANKEMLDVYNEIRQMGKRVIITTDMYLKAETLDVFLKKNGFEGYGYIYCSADERKAKFNRELFEEVAKREGCGFGEILHIGDNETADVAIPADLGIATFLYKRSGDPEKGFWYNFGMKIAGPVYLGLYRWLERRIKELAETGEDFYFLSRDGYYLYNLFKNNGYTNVKYIYASRRSLIMAGITELDEDALNVLPPYSFGQTVGDVIDYLGLDREAITGFEKAGFEGTETVISTPEDLKRFKNLYKLNEEVVLNRCAVERKNAEKYFKSVPIEKKCEHSINIFDCGWNGSSQYLLERFLDTDTFFYYFGILNTPKSRKQLRGKKYKAYLFDFYRDYNFQREVFTSTEIYELLFSASHPSVFNYSEDGVCFEEQENGKDDFKDEILKGIERYFSEILDFVEKFNPEIKKEIIVSHLRRLVNNPTEEEARIIGDTPNSDGIAGKTGEKKKLAYCEKEELLTNPRLDGFWLQGLLARSDVPEDVKSAAKKRMGAPAVQSDYRLEQTVDLLYYQNRFEYYFGEGTTCRLRKKPFFSIVMPVYNIETELLRKAIDSVLVQTYNRFELILVDDCSTWENVRPVLKEYEKNRHVKVIYRRVNGNISRATNDGIKKAKGEFLFFMDCDDCIEPYALYEFAKKLNEEPKLDFIYSDEDKLTEDGKIKHLPFFKPDWSPDLFMCENYTNHLSAYRTSIVKKTGGLRSKYDGAQDYDFVLRFMEKTDNSRVGHISRILYHWRERKQSVAFSLDSKSYATTATMHLKEDALKRRNIKGHTEFVSEVSQYRVVYETDGNPLISIIIPSKDNPDVLKRCVDSVIKHTEYKNFELIVVDNGSSDENRRSVEVFLEEKKHILSFQYIYEKAEFNFSHMCNLGAKAARGEYLLFLNDDVEAIEGDWLGRMLGHSMQSHVGAVGAKLFYPETTIIQHAGVNNIDRGPGHAFFRQDDATLYYFGLNRLESNFIAVTAACLMIAKEKFIKAGMFDEELKVAYNDIDLCFKLYKLGYYNTVRQDAVLYHHESLSRGIDDESPEKKIRLEAERTRLYEKHPDLEGRDPFLNPAIHTLFGPELDLNPVYGKIEELNDQGSIPLSRAFIDSISLRDNIYITGWAFVENKDNLFTDVKYVIFDDGKGKRFRIKTDSLQRDDVVEAFGGREDIRFCGFKCIIKPENVQEKYKIGVQIVDSAGQSHIYWEERQFCEKK